MCRFCSEYVDKAVSLGWTRQEAEDWLWECTAFPLEHPTREQINEIELMKKPLKDLKIDDFLHVIPWNDIRQRMYAKDFKAFLKWMRGQTTSMEGCYPCDLERFLTKGGPKAQVYD